MRSPYLPNFGFIYRRITSLKLVPFSYSVNQTWTDKQVAFFQVTSRADQQHSVIPTESENKQKWIKKGRTVLQFTEHDEYVKFGLIMKYVLFIYLQFKIWRRSKQKKNSTGKLALL